MSELPAPGEPLVLADGTKIDPTTGSVLRDRSRVEIPRASEAKELVTRTRMRLRDMPVRPGEGLNTISVIVMYSLMGLENDEIALALNIEERQVQNVRMSDTFGQLQDMFMKQIVERDSEGVRTMIAQHSHKAAQTMIGLLDSESDQIAMSAAKDLLDRDGHRPADVVEHRHTMDGGLTITYIERKEGEDAIPITEFERIDDAE